jgi:hypothetical protein
MDTNLKILLAGAIIDFHIDKDKYEKYKTRKSKYNYVYKVLQECIVPLTGTYLDEAKKIQIRDVSITSNHFWGREKLCIINDIGYSETNMLELNEDFITVRIFKIDIVATAPSDITNTECFHNIENEDYKILTSSTKLI